MSDIKQDLKNHRQVATACKSYADTEIASAKTECKNYTDAQIAASEERMKWYISETTPTTSNDNTTAYVKTVPANATRAKIKRIYGLTQKFNPTTAADDTSYMVKTMPATVYDFDVSKVEGASVKYNQLVQYGNFPDDTHVYEGYNASKSVSDNVLTLTTIDSSVTGNRYASTSINLKQNHKYLGVAWYYIPTISSYNGSPTLAFAGNFEGTYYHQNIAVLDSSVSSNIGKWIEVYGIVTWSNPTGRFNYNFVFDRVDELRVRQAQVFDLTDIFGAGNEPSTYEDAKAALIRIGIDTMSFNTYSEGEIHNFAWTGVNTKKCNMYDITNVNSKTNNITITGSEITMAPRDYTQIFYVNMPFNDTTNTYTYTFEAKSDINGSIMTADLQPDTGSGLGVDRAITLTTSWQTFTYTGTLSGIVKGLRFFRISNQANYNTANIYIRNVMFVKGSTAPSEYIPYLSTTQPIDLSTILYNGSPLFTNGLCSIGSIKDELTPYKATKKINRIKVSELTINYNSELAIFYTYVTKKVGITNVSMAGFDTVNKYYTQLANLELCGVESTQGINFVDTSCQDLTAFHNKYDNYYIYYEDYYGPIEVSIDWSSTLRGIQGYSNGTITLQNTYNMDTANLITYNSIIKEVLNTGVRLDGSNMWDEDFEVGSIDVANGQNINATATCRGANYTKVNPNSTYILNYVYRVFYYDTNKNYLGYSGIADTTGVGGTINTPNNCEYIRFNFVSEYGTTYKNNIRLNRGNTLLPYYPYKESITVNFPTTASDAYSAGSVSNVRDFTTWKRGINIDKADMNNYNYAYDGSRKYFYTGALTGLIKTPVDGRTAANIVSNRYSVDTQDNIFHNIDQSKGLDMVFGIQPSPTLLMIINSYYDDGTIFKTASTGDKLYYEKNIADESAIEQFNNILEVEEGDTLTFLNSENMAVPSDITYRIEVAN